MSTTINAEIAHAAPFPSLASLRVTHSELLKRERENGDAPLFLDEVADFIRRGQATGALLDVDADRWAVQSLLDYWTTVLYRVGREPPDAALAEFDHELAPKLDDALCPYLGLDAFQEANHDRFYGRQRLIEELVARLQDNRFLAVIGPSGSGKSSLVRAGLVPALKAGALPGSQNWRCYLPIVPGSDPLASLARLLQPADSTPAEWSESQARLFREDSNHLADLINSFSDAPAVLIVDQFEELFTLCDDDQTRQAFSANLLGLIQAPGARHTVILTMRSDFEMFIARLPTLQPLFEQAQVRVTPLSAGDLREAIEKPAKLAGLKFEGGVVDALLQDILGEPAGLPLLQFTLLKLWENRERNRVTLESYRRLGGGRLALARSADDFYKHLILEEQATAKRILLRMIRPGEGLEVTSNRVRREALYQGGEARDRVDRVLDKLIHARLVRLTEGETPADSQVEVAHEALVRNWPTLVDWLADERAAITTRRRLEAKAAEWVRLGQGKGGLLDEVELHEAERWLASSEATYLGYNEALSALVKASQAAQSEKIAQQRRAARFRLGAVITIAVLIIAALGILLQSVRREAQNERQQAEVQANARATAEAGQAEAISARAAAEAHQAEAVAAQATAVAEGERAAQQSRLARSGQLAAQAQSVLEDFPQRSLLLAVEALSVTLQKSEPPAPVAEDALRQVLAATGGHSLNGHTARINAIAISADNHWLVTGSADGTARLWNLNAPDPAATPIIFRGDVNITAVAISHDNHWLVTGGAGPARSPNESVGSGPEAPPVAPSVPSSGEDNALRLWNLTAKNPTADPIVLRDHGGGVTAIAISTDNHWLATGGTDNIVRLWDLTANDPAGTSIILPGHTDNVTSIAISADSHWLITGSGYMYRDYQGNLIIHGDNTARLWNLTAKNPAANMIVLPGHEGPIFAVAISPDNHWLATGSADKSARLWDLRAKNPAAHPIILRGHADIITTVAFSADSRRLATGSTDNNAYLWDVTAKDPTANPVILHGHKSAITATAISPDNHWLVTGSADNTARLWDLTAKDPAANPVVLRSHEDAITAVAFSADSRRLVTGSADTTVRLWSLSSPAAAPVVLHGQTGPVFALAFSHDNQWLLTGGTDLPFDSISGSPSDAAITGTARLWNLTAADPTAKPVALRGFGSLVWAAAFSPNNHWLATVEANLFQSNNNPDVDYKARLWDMTAADPSAHPIELRGHEGQIWTVAFSPDGHWLVTGGDDKIARLWDMTAADPSAHPIELRGHTEPIWAAVFSPDGHWLATTSAYVFSNGGGPPDQALDRAVRLWDMTVKDPAANPIVLRGHEESVLSIAFSPDGHWLVTAGGDVRSGPAGSSADSESNTARLWDLTAKDPAANPIVLHGHAAVIFAVTISPDSHWLATGSFDNTARLWDLTAKDPRSNPIILRGHEAEIVAVAISPDDHWLVTAGQDKTARLWDLTAKDPATAPRVLRGHEDLIWSVAFSPDSHWLATGGFDSTARLWPLRVEDMVSLACRTASRNLTLAEWAQYMGKEPYRKTCSNLPIHPSFVNSFVEAGKELARAGDVASATAQFQKARDLDPTIDLDPNTSTPDAQPEVVARRFAASGLATKADDLARQGKVQEAIAAFQQAQKLDPTLADSAEFWNTLCWFGSITGHAADVLSACEQAVSLATDDNKASYLDSRGLARALTGHRKGAIEDFKSFVLWAKQHNEYEREVSEREAWIADLEGGRNPFTPEVLESIRNG